MTLALKERPAQVVIDLSGSAGWISSQGNPEEVRTVGDPVDNPVHDAAVSPETAEVSPESEEQRNDRFERDALVYLDQHGFRPGADALVRDRAPDGTLVLEVEGRTVAIGPSGAPIVTRCSLVPMIFNSKALRRSVKPATPTPMAPNLPPKMG